MSQIALPASLERQLLQSEGNTLPSDSIIVRSSNGQWVVRRQTICKEPLASLNNLFLKPVLTTMNILFSGEQCYRVHVTSNLEMIPIPDLHLKIGTHTPMVPIDLSQSERIQALIPEKATHYCWCYPIMSLEELQQGYQHNFHVCMQGSNASVSFVFCGGFAYCTKDKIGNIKCIKKVAMVPDSSTPVKFKPAAPWRSSYTSKLFREERFHQATLPALTAAGVQLFCYIHPNEVLYSNKDPKETWIPCRNGGFVFLYDQFATYHHFDVFFEFDNSDIVSNSPLSSTSTITSSSFSSRSSTASIPIPTTSISTCSSSPCACSPPSDTGVPSCVVCLANPVDTMIANCKHVCMCKECVVKVAVCPLCRGDATYYTAAFL